MKGNVARQAAGGHLGSPAESPARLNLDLPAPDRLRELALPALDEEGFQAPRGGLRLERQRSEEREQQFGLDELDLPLDAEASDPAGGGPAVALRVARQEQRQGEGVCQVEAPDFGRRCERERDRSALECSSEADAGVGLGGQVLLRRI